MEGGVIQWLNQFEQSQNVRDGLIACHKNGGGEDRIIDAQFVGALRTMTKGRVVV